MIAGHLRVMTMESRSYPAESPSRGRRRSTRHAVRRIVGIGISQLNRQTSRSASVQPESAYSVGTSSIGSPVLSVWKPSRRCPVHFQAPDRNRHAEIHVGQFQCRAGRPRDRARPRHSARSVFTTCGSTRTSARNAATSFHRPRAPHSTVDANWTICKYRDNNQFHNGAIMRHSVRSGA